MFSTFDCAIKGWRQKEDAWNAIMSGFMTGGCLALRSKSMSRRPLNRSHAFAGGPRSAFGSAVACGILLGVFEGVGVLMSRVFSEQTRPQMAPRKQQYATDSLLAHVHSSTWRHPANISPFVSLVNSPLFYMIHLHSMFSIISGRFSMQVPLPTNLSLLCNTFDSFQRFAGCASAFLPVPITFIARTLEPSVQTIWRQVENGYTSHFTGINYA